MMVNFSHPFNILRQSKISWDLLFNVQWWFIVRNQNTSMELIVTIYSNRQIILKSISSHIQLYQILFFLKCCHKEIMFDGCNVLYCCLGDFIAKVWPSSLRKWFVSVIWVFKIQKKKLSLKCALYKACVRIRYNIL